MKLAIGNDHVAVEMKNEIKAYLQQKGIEIVDVGTNSTERFNYPVSGYRVAKLVAAEYDTGLPVESIAGIASTLIESKGSDIPTAEIASAASSIAGNYGVDISAEQASAIASLIEGFINK